MKTSLAATDAPPADADPALARLATLGRTLARRFNQRNQRERLLLVAACAALVLLLADSLWLAPALAGFKEARATLAPLVRGLAFGLSNPKAYPVAIAMFTALLAGHAASLDWSMPTPDKAARVQRWRRDAAARRAAQEQFLGGNVNRRESPPLERQRC